MNKIFIFDFVLKAVAVINDISKNILISGLVGTSVYLLTFCMLRHNVCHTRQRHILAGETRII